MSSIRLFILGALADEGEMHGHQLRQLAEQEHIDEWTDVTVGALYGALKRLAAEGLIESVRTEREGAYPERQVWRITHDGEAALARIQLDGLRDIQIRPDPFDLAISRPDLARADEIPGLIALRIARLRAMLDESEAHIAMISRYLSPLELMVMAHKPARLRAEIAWHEELAAHLPDLLDSEKSRKDAR